MKINLKWRVLDLHNRKKEEKEKEHAPDYRKYTFSRKEILLYGAQGVGIAALLAWFFYHSFWAVLPLSPLILFTFKETEKNAHSQTETTAGRSIQRHNFVCRSRAAGRILH